MDGNATDRIDVSELNDDRVGWTLLATLYLRAWESRGERPILGDPYAAAALERIDYDAAELKRRTRPESNQYLVGLRARMLDDWARAFLARHPDAVVLHLGCGLDSRMLRLDPPAPALWFDLDLPASIEVRRKLYPERDRYRTIGASATDSDWLGEIPTGRPTLVIAEGLLGYLAEEDVRQLLGRLTDRFRTGELIFDGAAPWLARLVPLWQWGIRDGRRIERWNPRLTCIEQVPVGGRYDLVAARLYRTIYRVGNAIPFWRHMFSGFRFELR
jgi:O-methyltransferase involved in polyketide biosynthesis